MRSLALNFTNIRGLKCEQLIKSKSIEKLELMKFTRSEESGGQYIKPINIIAVFSAIANRNKHKWITLKLDIDAFEVTDHIRVQIPRNSKVLNVGWKK